MAGVHADATSAYEEQRIEYLIRSVEQLSNAKFIRNGSSYDAQAAADHLRLKLQGRISYQDRGRLHPALRIQELGIGSAVSDQFR